MRSAELNNLLLEIKKERTGEMVKFSYVDCGTHANVRIVLNDTEAVNGFNNTVSIDIPFNYPVFVAKAVITARIEQLVKEYENALKKEVDELIESLSLPEAIFLLAILSPDRAEQAIKELINRS